MQSGANSSLCSLLFLPKLTDDHVDHAPYDLQGQEYACEDPPPLKLDFVHVGGRYRVGNLLGSGGLDESNSESLAVISHFSDTSLGSIYLGRDIQMGGDVAIKIGYPGLWSLRLVHEYQVYMRIASCTGTCPVL